VDTAAEPYRSARALWGRRAESAPAGARGPAAPDGTERR
jgi:hypothetical protein